MELGCEAGRNLASVRSLHGFCVEEDKYVKFPARLADFVQLRCVWHRYGAILGGPLLVCYWTLAAQSGFVCKLSV